MTAARVLLVDDDPFFVEALAAILALDERIEIVARAGDGAEAVALAVELRPDIVVMDVHMPIMDGFEATQRIREAVPGTEVFFLTASSEPEVAEKAFRCGAVGFLTKDRLGSGLVEIVLGILRERGGGQAFRRKFPAAAASLRARALHPPSPPEALLSPSRRPRDRGAASLPRRLRPL
jgi:DNA-binding NarL/FixJ family response regulator